jgi:hypothetical protein
MVKKYFLTIFLNIFLKFLAVGDLFRYAKAPIEYHVHGSFLLHSQLSMLKKALLWNYV